MLSIILALFMAWLFFKLGIGIIKIIAFLFVFGIAAVFFTYLLIPFLAIVFVGGLLFAAVK